MVITLYRRRPLFLVLLMVGLLSLSGCASTLSSTFVNAMREHNQDTRLVNGSLVSTFQEEMNSETRPEARAAYQEIINNLNTISHQAEVLDRYVWKNLTEKELALVLRSKWRVKP